MAAVIRRFYQLCEMPGLLGHRDGDGLAGTALSDPDGVAGGFDTGRRVEAILEHGEACFVAVNGERRNFAAAIFCDEELAVCSAHAVGAFDGLIDPDVDRRSWLARGIDGNAIELIEDDVVHVEDAIEKRDAIDATEDAILEVQLRSRSAGREAEDPSGESVGDVQRLV